MKGWQQDDGRAGLASPLLIVGVGAVLVAVALGLAAAYALTGSGTAGGASKPRPTAKDASGNFEYVPFGSTVVNLSGGRLTRYLQVNVTLKVPQGSGATVTELVEGEKAAFKNWLITYLSDKRLDEVEGAAAIRRLQREIKDGFNVMLADRSEGLEVESVLFEEFNIQ
jgi:flagellar basal body-associated protein FliL